MGGDGNDRVLLGANATLLGGTIDGGEGSDTIDYSAYSTAVTVDLSTGQQFFTATLSGTAEVPPNASTATGMGTFTLNTAGTQLAFNVSYDDLQGQLLGVPGFASSSKTAFTMAGVNSLDDRP